MAPRLCRRAAGALSQSRLESIFHAIISEDATYLPHGRVYASNHRLLQGMLRLQIVAVPRSWRLDTSILEDNQAACEASPEIAASLPELPPTLDVWDSLKAEPHEANNRDTLEANPLRLTELFAVHCASTVCPIYVGARYFRPSPSTSPGDDRSRSCFLFLNDDSALFALCSGSWSFWFTFLIAGTRF